MGPLRFPLNNNSFLASCEKCLLGFLKEIEPTDVQKDGASRSHNFLRSILDTGNMANRVVDSYLSGSYSRDTAIRPLDDVDIVFVIDHQRWPRNGLSLFLSEYPEPEAVLITFANAIRYRYPNSSLRLQNKSVRLKLNHLNIDVVPAIDHGKNDGRILIPDRQRGDWIQTAPKRHGEIASAINQQQEGLFKPLVKLLKYWNVGLPSTANFKSFAIETIACRIFQKMQLPSVELGLLYFFDFIASFADDAEVSEWRDQFDVSLGWLQCEVPDLAGTNSNVVAAVGESRKLRFIDNAIVARNRLLDAYSARSEKTAWKRVSQALRC